MNIAYKALLAGVLAIVFTGPAIAHDAREGAWAGGLTVAVTPRGQLAWSGGLAYGPVVAYAARPVVVAAPPVYRPVCGHPSHRRHAAHHRGHKHWKRHRHAHPRHH
jgi:hypothetical protein